MVDLNRESALASIDIPELRTAFTFRRRPVPLPADLRPVWRIALIVLLLRKCCRQGRTSIARLHVLSWGLRTEESREQLLAASDGKLTPDALIVRFEPFLSLAIDFALAERLIARDGGDRVVLTASGNVFADEIEANIEVLAPEKDFMGLIKGKITEGMVKQMFGWEASA